MGAEQDGKPQEGTTSAMMMDKVFVELRRDRRFRYIRLITLIFIFLGAIFFFADGPSSSSLVNRLGKTGEIDSFILQEYCFEATGKETQCTGGEGSKRNFANAVVIPLEGAIDGGSSVGSSDSLFSDTRQILKSIDCASPDLDLVILYINSPGGSVISGDEIYFDLKKCREQGAENNTRMIVYVSSMALSGGYYIAQAGEEIIANRNALIGNIGVLLPGIGFSRLADRLGVESRNVTTGLYKDAGNPLRDQTEEERAMLQTLADQVLEQFIDVIMEGRSGKMTREEVKALADGRIFSAQDAKQNKLIDDVMRFDDLMGREILRSKEEGLDGLRITIYEKEHPLFPFPFK